MATFTAVQAFDESALPDPLVEQFYSESIGSNSSHGVLLRLLPPFDGADIQLALEGTDFGFAVGPTTALYLYGIVEHVKLSIGNSGVFEISGLHQHWSLLQSNEITAPPLPTYLAQWLEGDDSIIGSAGNDFLSGYGGNNFIDGDAGLDFAAYDSARGEYDIRLGSNKVATVRHSSGAADTLINVERLRFSDCSVALDLGTNQNGGQAVRLVTAIAGENALADKSVVGEILFYIDHVGLGRLIESGLNAGVVMRFAGGPSDDQLIGLLYRNMTGHDASAADLQFNVQYMHDAGFTQSEAIEYALNLPATAVAADLVGLQQQGLAYLEY